MVSMCIPSNFALSNYALCICTISNRNLSICTLFNCTMLKRDPLTSPKIYFPTLVVLSQLAVTPTKYYCHHSVFHNKIECLFVPTGLPSVISLTLSHCLCIYIYIHIYIYIIMFKEEYIHKYYDDHRKFYNIGPLGQSTTL
jgi:hypothetical protein